MRIAGPLLAATLLGAVPAQALSLGSPACHDFDRSWREAISAAVVTVVSTGESRRDGDEYVTPVRAVVEEVVKGPTIRRDQTVAAEIRSSAFDLDGSDAGPPWFPVGSRHLMRVDRDGEVRMWMPIKFYFRQTLRNCYRRSLISRAG